MSRRPHGWGQGTRRQPLSATTRRLVLERDNYQCQLRWDTGCTGQATEVDHIELKSLGGPDTVANGRASCTHCNAARNYSLRPRPRSTRRPVEPPPGLINP